jgi:Mg2+ and Co2+ transporter CorA
MEEQHQANNFASQRESLEDHQLASKPSKSHKENRRNLLVDLRETIQKHNISLSKGCIEEILVTCADNLLCSSDAAFRQFGNFKRNMCDQETQTCGELNKDILLLHQSILDQVQVVKRELEHQNQQMMTEIEEHAQYMQDKFNEREELIKAFISQQELS